MNLNAESRALPRDGEAPWSSEMQRPSTTLVGAADLQDLQRLLQAALNLESLMELIPNVVQPLLACEAVHLWLFDADALTLKSTAGHDPTISVGTQERPEKATSPT